MSQILEVQLLFSQVVAFLVDKVEEGQEIQAVEEVEVAHLVEMVQEVMEVKVMAAKMMIMAIKMNFLIQILAQSIIV